MMRGLSSSRWHRHLDLATREAALATRSLSRTPGFVVALVLTIGLGVGATTAAFAVVDRVLLRPLPIIDQDRVLSLWAERRDAASSHVALRNEFVEDFTARSRSFSAIARVMAGGATPFTGRDGDRILAMSESLVGGEFFTTLGVRPQLGRLLVSDDDAAGAGSAIVLSSHAWQQNFGGDSSVIGRSIDFQGARQTIIGVAPAGFDFPKGTDVWAPYTQFERRLSPTPSPQGGWFDLVARLRPGISPGAASAEFATYLAHSDAAWLPDPSDRRAVATPYANIIVGDLRPGLLILMAAVALVLLVALVNVIGLLTTRALDRAEDLALRVALGASRGQLIAHLAFEGAALALTGGLLGIAVGWGAVKVAIALAPAGLARFDEIHLDWTSLVFALALTLGTIALVGLAPAMLATRSFRYLGIRSANHSTSADASLSWSRGGMRPILAVVQVALAVTVLAGGGLLVRTLFKLERLSLGFESEHLVFVVLSDLQSGSDEEAIAVRLRTVVDALDQRLPKQPGIVAAAPTFAIPFNAVGGAPVIEVHYALEGQGLSTGLTSPAVRWEAASPSYFATFRIPLIRGRLFDDTDQSTGESPLAIVSESMARRAWPGQDAIGKRLRLVSQDGVGLLRTIVGVVGDTRYLDLSEVEPAVYTVPGQTTASAVLAVRTVRDPGDMVPIIRRVLGGVDQGYVVRKAVTMPELLDAQLARPRLLSSVLGALSVAAAFLTAIGLYGVLSYMIRQREREFAIRLAIGATPNAIQLLVLREGSRLTLIGLAIGLLFAIAATRVLRSQLFQVAPADPATLIGVSLMLLLVAAIACILPARRAIRTDPQATMRA